MIPRNAMSRAAWLALLLSCILLSSCSALQERAYYPRSASAVCLPSFPDKDGWYGGDGAYSIRLDDRRVLWLFGDYLCFGSGGPAGSRGYEGGSRDDAGHLNLHR